MENTGIILKPLKKVIKYDSYFANYLLEKSKADFWDYDKLIDFMGSDDFLSIFWHDYGRVHLFKMNDGKDISHSIVYLLIKNDISIEEINRMFKFSYTTQQYFEYLYDNLFEKIKLFHSKGFIIEPFLHQKRNVNLLEENEFLKRNVLNKIDNVKQFVEICRLYKIKLPSKILKDYSVFDKYQINYINSNQQNFHYHIKSELCKNLKQLVECGDIFEEGEEYTCLKKFLQEPLEASYMLLDFDMRQFFLLENQIVAGTYNTNSLLDFCKFLETYNVRIRKESIMKDISLEHNEPNKFIILGKTYDKEKNTETYKILMKLMEFVI
jgi:hypothetical protein